VGVEQTRLGNAQRPVFEVADDQLDDDELAMLGLDERERVGPRVGACFPVESASASSSANESVT
jgi:hypothetical protein